MSDTELRERVAKLLRYEPEAGRLLWLVSGHGRGGKFAPGDEAGTLKDGYLQVKLFGRVYRAHRLAWLLVNGEFPPSGFEIDHRNRKRSDNRWSNLRLATRSQNNINAAPGNNNSSGHRGVSWRSDRNKWHARINVNRKPILLGDFDDLRAAVEARRLAEREHYGAFAR